MFGRVNQRLQVYTLLLCAIQARHSVLNLPLQAGQDSEVSLLLLRKFAHIPQLKVSKTLLLLVELLPLGFHLVV